MDKRAHVPIQPRPFIKPPHYPLVSPQQFYPDHPQPQYLLKRDGYNGSELIRAPAFSTITAVNPHPHNSQNSQPHNFQNHHRGQQNVHLNRAHINQHSSSGPIPTQVSQSHISHPPPTQVLQHISGPNTTVHNVISNSVHQQPGLVPGPSPPGPQIDHSATMQPHQIAAGSGPISNAQILVPPQNNQAMPHQQAQFYQPGHASGIAAAMARPIFQQGIPQQYISPVVGYQGYQNMQYPTHGQIGLSGGVNYNGHQLTQMQYAQMQYGTQPAQNTFYANNNMSAYRQPQLPPQAPQVQPPVKPYQVKTRKHAIKIVDPNTNKELDQLTLSLTQSKESSTSNTPAPSEVGDNKPAIQADFALQVALSIDEAKKPESLDNSMKLNSNLTLPQDSVDSNVSSNSASLKKNVSNSSPSSQNNFQDVPNHFSNQFEKSSSQLSSNAPVFPQPVHIVHLVEPHTQPSLQPQLQSNRIPSVIAPKVTIQKPPPIHTAPLPPQNQQQIISQKPMLVSPKSHGIIQVPALQKGISTVIPATVPLKVTAGVITPSFSQKVEPQMANNPVPIEKKDQGVKLASVSQKGSQGAGPQNQKAPKQEKIPQAQPVYLPKKELSDKSVTPTVAVTPQISTNPVPIEKRDQGVKPASVSQKVSQKAVPQNQKALQHEKNPQAQPVDLPKKELSDKNRIPSVIAPEVTIQKPPPIHTAPLPPHNQQQIISQKPMLVSPKSHGIIQVPALQKGISTVIPATVPLKVTAGVIAPSFSQKVEPQMAINPVPIEKKDQGVKLASVSQKGSQGVGSQNQKAPQQEKIPQAQPVDLPKKELSDKSVTPTVAVTPQISNNPVPTEKRDQGVKPASVSQKVSQKAVPQNQKALQQEKIPQAQPVDLPKKELSDKSVTPTVAVTKVVTTAASKLVAPTQVTKVEKPNQDNKAVVNKKEKEVPSDNDKKGKNKKFFEEVVENHVEEEVIVPEFECDYKDGQWRPDNPTGKKQYDAAFLKNLMKHPLAQVKPDSLPDLEVVLDAVPNRNFEEYKPSKNTADIFAPAYIQTNRGPQRGHHHGGYNMQINKMPGIGGRGMHNMPTKKVPKVIDIKLTPSSEVQLKKAENAWKPKPSDEADSAQEMIIKKMRGILNKLTPDNFKNLTEKVQNLNPDTSDTFKSMLELIFEKAVDEQGFSATYADLCTVLQTMSVKKDCGDEAKFRHIIITLCQNEFEADYKDKLDAENWPAKIAEATDPAEKAELTATYEHRERKLRQRSVGNVKFIGELYKRKMLTSGLMVKIMRGLLAKDREESYECICKLFSTMGKMLEESALKSGKTAMEEINGIFMKLNVVVSEKQTSSRVRCLILDVVELRSENWVPRHKEVKAKSKKEVHDEIKKEEDEKSINRIIQAPPPKSNARNDNTRSKKGGTCSTQSQEWQHVYNKKTPFEASRMNAFKDSSHHLVGGKPVSFSSNKTSEKDDSSLGFRPGGNRFNALDQRDNMRPNVGPRLQGREPPYGHRDYHPQSYGSKSMPGPHADRNEFSSTPTSATGKYSTIDDRSKSNSRTSSRGSTREPSPAQLDPEKAQLKTKAIIEEYIAQNNIKEIKSEIQESFKGDNLKQFVHSSLFWVIERNPESFKKLGDLLSILLSNHVLSTKIFISGSKETIEQFDDFIIDNPKLCSYMGELFCRCISEKVFTLKNFWNYLEPAGQIRLKAFVETVKLLPSVKSESETLSLWKSSQLNWQQVLVDKNVEEYLKDQKLQFLYVTESIDFTYIRKELKAFFTDLKDNEIIFNWIEEHCEKQTKDKEFICALVSALIDSLLECTDGSTWSVSDKFEETLTRYCNVLNKYIDNDEARELECLFAIQKLSTVKQHPKRLVVRSFRSLLDNELISEETFTTWRDDEDPNRQIGKPLCVTTLNPFFKWLSESEPDDNVADSKSSS